MNFKLNCESYELNIATVLDLGGRGKYRIFGKNRPGFDRILKTLNIEVVEDELNFPEWKKYSRFDVGSSCYSP